MATQRLTIATIAGASAVAIAARFDEWRSSPDPASVDQLCTSICEHATALPIIYFTEWVDRWLMGNLVPGPDEVEGRRFQATCLSPGQALEWAAQCGSQFAEQGWLAIRFREAAAGWGGIGEPYAVVAIREVVGPTTDDEEVEIAARHVPPWLPLSGPDAERPS